MNKQELIAEISQKLDHHHLWFLWNFGFLLVLTWLSIIASAASAFLVAIGSPKKWLTALLAIIPALCLTAESTFSFSGRYKFHNEFVTELEILSRRVRIEGLDEKKGSAALTDLQRRLEQNYPSLTVIGNEAPRQVHPGGSTTPANEQ